MASLSKYFIENENIGLYEQIFENVNIMDCHTHIGVDRDSHRLGAKQLVKMMASNDINQAISFPLDDPKAGTDFSRPNERIRIAYRKYPKRIIPFFRLNPNHNWEKEFEKRTGQGFRGVKLHPRSQGFEISAQAAMKLYDKMEKAGLILLIHAGFGLEYVADELYKVAKAFPKLRIIIGHGGFVELDNVIKLLKERENILFDTSTMRVFDLMELMKNVSYRKITFGSDTPIYDQTLALQMLVDSAAIAKQTPNQVRSMLGENLQKWLK